MREGQLLARLRHRNIVEVFDCGLIGDTFYLACELVEGETLTALLQRAPLSPPEVTWVLSELLAGLAAAHREGVWHRDVKPSNVLIGSAGNQRTVKLLDFGVAKDELGEDLTAEGALIGTPRYLAPEMLRGAPGSARTDLWALGVLACECATGVPGYPGKSPGIFREILAGPPAALHHLAATDLGPVLARLLAPAEHRVQSAAEALALLSSLPQHPISGRRLGRPTLFGTVADFVAPGQTAIPTLQPSLTSAPTQAPARRAQQAGAPPETWTEPPEATPPAAEPRKKRSWLPIVALAGGLALAVTAGSLMAVLGETDALPGPVGQSSNLPPPHATPPVATLAPSTIPMGRETPEPNPALGGGPADAPVDKREEAVDDAEAPMVQEPAPPRAATQRAAPRTAAMRAAAMRTVAMRTAATAQAAVAAQPLRRAPRPSTPRVVVGAPPSVRGASARCQTSNAEVRRRWQAAIECARSGSNEMRRIRISVHASGAFECAPTSNICTRLRSCPRPIPMGEFTCTSE